MFAKTWRAMIDSFGEPVKLVRPAMDGDPEVTVNLTGYLLRYSTKERQDGQRQGVREIRITNDEIAASALSGDPQETDKAYAGGKEYTLQSVDAVRDGDGIVGYILSVAG